MPLRWKFKSQNTRRNKKSIHDVLPVELIARILIFAARPESHYSDILCLSLINSRMREIVLGTPQLWTTIKILSQKQIQFGRLCLERSKECGVDCFVLMTSLEQEAMVEIGSFLRECQPKMKSFEITAADIQNPFLASTIAELDLPFLQDFSYEVGSGSYLTTTFQIPHMPQLRSICITGRIVPVIPSRSDSIEGTPYRYDHLSQLTLHSCTLHELHFQQLLDFMAHAPALEHISFIVVGVDGHAQEINVSGEHAESRGKFTNIRHLTFRQASVGHLKRIFKIIDPFQLETIELGDIDEPAYAWLKDEKMVFPSVRRFIISPEKEDTSHTLGVHDLALVLMETFPHLTEVEIPYWRAKLLTDWMYHFPPPEMESNEGPQNFRRQSSGSMEPPWAGIRSIRVTREPKDDLSMEIALAHLSPFAHRSKPYLKAPLHVLIGWRRPLATACAKNLMRSLEGAVGRMRL